LPDRLIFGTLLLMMLMATGIAAQPSTNFDSIGYEEAISTILCDCGCHPQSVKACACGRAAEMRDDMRRMIASGMSGEEIIDDYVAKNGEQIRIAPVASGFNLVAWIGPLIGLILACIGLFWLIRHWSKGSSPEDGGASAPVANVAGDDPYREKLRAAMEKME